MARLIYSVIASLDGYVADEKGNFDWAEPDEEVHTFVYELERPVGTYLYGRAMYETMVYWETAGGAGEPPVVRDFAEMWRDAAKVVYSRTLETVSSDRTRIERDFDPDAVRQMKAEAERDMTVGGPGLAAVALAEGPGRRVPDVRGADRRRRRQTVAAEQCPAPARVARRASLRQRHGVSPLSLPELRSHRRRAGEVLTGREVIPGARNSNKAPDNAYSHDLDTWDDGARLPSPLPLAREVQRRPIPAD